MSNINKFSNSPEDPISSGLAHNIDSLPLPFDGSGSLALANASEWIERVAKNPDLSVRVGFDPSIFYSPNHIDELAQLLKQMVETPQYKEKGIFPAEYIRSWQELQWKVLMESLGPEIGKIAGGILTNVWNTRTRIGDLMEKPWLSSFTKAGFAAGSFGIMGLFQYRFLESLMHAIAQHDINSGKTWPLVQFVANHSAMLGSGVAWSAMTVCAFAWLAKQGFETHLSDKLHGTNRWKKKLVYGLGALSILGVEMTWSFSRITIGKDLEAQVHQMKKWVKGATAWDTTIFAEIDTKTWDLADIYTKEWTALFEAEAARWGVGPYAAAKQAAYLPKSQIDWSKVDRVPWLRQKVDALYIALEWHRKKMTDIQEANGLDGSSGKKETSWPLVLSVAGYQVAKVAKWLDTISTKAVDEILEAHNLIDPSLKDIILDLVFDGGKKLHPQDVNSLRTILDRQIDKSWANVDALTEELGRTIDTIDAYMREMTEAANIAYRSEASYTPKPKPAKIDTSTLKESLKETKTPVTVLDPFGVWSKFFELSKNGTIPFGYSLALFLRVLLVEALLTAIAIVRVRQTNRALSTPGARFEDLARETDGQYLRIVSLIERLTGGQAWQMTNGKALSREEIHTLVSTTLASQEWQAWLWNHMSVVTLQWKKISSSSQKLKDLLWAAFFAQYSAPEIRRLHALDKSLMFWKEDIAWVPSSPKANWEWITYLRGILPSINWNNQKNDELAIDAASWDTPQVTVRTGEGKVQSQIEAILANQEALRTISTSTQKRLAREDTGQKKRDWESIRGSLHDYISSNPHLMGIVSRIRSDNNHPLFDHVVALDRTGDVFWYYKGEYRDIVEREKTLLGWKSEKEFYAGREKFIRDTATSLKQKLARLRDSWVLDPDDRSIIVWFLSTETRELFQQENIASIFSIITKHANNAFITRNVTQGSWETSPEFSYQEFSGKLSQIDASIEELQELQSRKKRVDRYMNISAETVTELEIMTLRNAAAQVKDYLQKQMR
jgi:hypothetical protein